MRTGRLPISHPLRGLSWPRPRTSRLGALLAASLLVWGCGGTTTVFAPDEGSDGGTDTAPRPDQEPGPDGPDLGPDVADDVGPDLATDVPVDVEKDAPDLPTDVLADTADVTTDEDPCADVVCETVNTCNRTACNPETRQCDPVITEGDSCDDGNACTQQDTCRDNLCESGMDRCPEPLAVVSGSTVTPLELVGNVGGGTLFEDVCPPGQALVGLVAGVGGSIDGLTAVCGRLTINGNGDPYGAGVTTGDTLTTRGAEVSGTQETAMCPQDQVVIGFDSATGALVDQLTLRCAALRIVPGTGGGNPGYAVMVDSVITPAGPVGGTGGGPNPPLNCPGGQIAFGTRIRAGSSVDAFSITCANPLTSDCVPPGAPSQGSGSCCPGSVDSAGTCTLP